MTRYREFWATQDIYKHDGIYVMCEDKQYIEENATIETEFKVIEYRAYEDLKKESDKVIKELVVVIEKMKNQESFDMHLADLEIINGTLIKAKEHLGE